MLLLPFPVNHISFYSWPNVLPLFESGWLNFWTIKYRGSDFAWFLSLILKKLCCFCLSLFGTLVSGKPIPLLRNFTTMRPPGCKESPGRNTERWHGKSKNPSQSLAVPAILEEATDLWMKSYKEHPDMLLLPPLPSDCNLMKELKNSAEPS